MKILLLNPPYDQEFPGEVRLESLGLGYIAASLRQASHDVEILDAQVQYLKPPDIIREIVSREFDCLGVTCANAHKKTVIPIIRSVRKEKKDALITAGGYLPTFNAQELLTAVPEIDFLVIGEGETVVADVFGRISRGEDWKAAPGLAYRSGTEAVVNPTPPRIEDLDSLPFPARDSLHQLKQPAPALISSSRGCYHRCAFCCIHGFYGLSGNKPPRFRRPGPVVDEIESVVAETGIRSFSFVDDDFIGPGPKTKERAMLIGEEIRARKLHVAFSIEARVDEIDEELLKLLKEAGLTSVFLGIESGVQAQLGRYNKRTTPEQNRRAIDLVRSLDLKLVAGFIMVDPYVTVAEVGENLQFVRDMKLQEHGNMGFFQFLMKLQLFRGLPVIDKIREDGLLREKGLEIDYIFKDPQFRRIYRIMQGFRACSSCLGRIAKPFRKQEPISAVQNEVVIPPSKAD